jgi:DNA gyrase/topoisomerase IV subunit A
MSNPILPSEFNVAGITVESTVDEDLRIDRDALSEEFEKHSIRFNFYAVSFELCQDHETRLKASMDRLYGLCDVQARAEMEMAKVKVTEKKVENMVITMSDYVKKQEEYFDACLQTRLMKAARDAMVHKKDCLISLGANIRAELQNDPYMKKQS